MIIRRFLQQHCIGYNEDLQTAYYSGVAEMDTGEIREVYLIEKGHGFGTWQQGSCPRPPIRNADFEEPA